MNLASMKLIPGLGRLIHPGRSDLAMIVWRDLKRRGREHPLPLALGAGAAEAPPVVLPSGEVTLFLDDNLWDAVMTANPDIFGLQCDLRERLGALQRANEKRFLWGDGTAPDVEIRLGNTGIFPWRVDVSFRVETSRSMLEKVGTLEAEGQSTVDLRPTRNELFLLDSKVPITILADAYTVRVQCPKGISILLPGSGRARSRATLRWGDIFKVSGDGNTVKCILTAQSRVTKARSAKVKPPSGGSVSTERFAGWRVSDGASLVLEIGPPGSAATMKVQGLKRTSAVELAAMGDHIEVNNRAGKITARQGRGPVSEVIHGRPHRCESPFTLTLDGRIRLSVEERGPSLLVRVAETVKVKRCDQNLVAGGGALFDVVSLAEGQDLGADGLVVQQERIS